MLAPRGPRWPSREGFGTPLRGVTCWPAPQRSGSVEASDVPCRHAAFRCRMLPSMVYTTLTDRWWSHLARTADIVQPTRRRRDELPWELQPVAMAHGAWAQQSANATNRVVVRLARIGCGVDVLRSALVLGRRTRFTDMPRETERLPAASS